MLFYGFAVNMRETISSFQKNIDQQYSMNDSRPANLADILSCEKVSPFEVKQPLANASNKFSPRLEREG